MSRQCVCDPRHAGVHCERDLCAGYCANKGDCYQDLLRAGRLAVRLTPDRDTELDTHTQTDISAFRRLIGGLGGDTFVGLGRHVRRTWMQLYG